MPFPFADKVDTVTTMPAEEMNSMRDYILMLQPKDQVCLAGMGAPSAELGVDGQGYFDLLNHAFYGPKDEGSWGSPSLISVGMSVYEDWVDRDLDYGGDQSFAGFLNYIAQLVREQSNLPIFQYALSLPSPAPDPGTITLIVPSLPSGL